MGAFSKAALGSETNFAVDWPTILCVDDDPNCVAAMERNFHPYKVKLERAYHGMQGIMNAVTRVPDVILTDLAMPLATGEELISCLTRNPVTQNTPIIVITGRPGATLTSRMRQMGVTDVLPKPLNFDRLLMLLSEVIAVELR